jgi:anti-anti-sigma factor
MEIKYTSGDKFDTIQPIGRLDSFTSPQLEEMLYQQIHAGRFNFIVDLSQLEYLSSSGIRVFVNAQKICLKKDGVICMVSTPDLIMTTFQLFGFDKIFQFYETLETAAASFEDYKAYDD